MYGDYLQHFPTTAKPDPMHDPKCPLCHGCGERFHVERRENVPCECVAPKPQAHNPFEALQLLYETLIAAEPDCLRRYHLRNLLEDANRENG